jgi:NTP pyrophosphatase (non-canonical NTP hydrolase)
MTLDEYQSAARRTAQYPDEVRLLYPVLKLTGEAGEVSEKLGKLMRDESWLPGQELTTAQREALAKELGDVLWYIANVAADLGLTLEEIGAGNIAKLADRQARGKIQGSGDDR